MLTGALVRVASALVSVANALVSIAIAVVCVTGALVRVANALVIVVYQLAGDDHALGIVVRAPTKLTCALGTLAMRLVSEASALV
jgi:hypothetical protein